MGKTRKDLEKAFLLVPARGWRADSTQNISPPSPRGYRRQNLKGKKSSENLGFLGGSVSKESAYNAEDHLKCRRPGFDPWVVKIPWTRK